MARKKQSLSVVQHRKYIAYSNMKFIPFSNNVEKYTQKVPITMAFLILSQLLIADNSIVDQPTFVENLFKNVGFKVFFIFVIAYTGSQDVEIALISTVVFIVLVNLLRTKDERKSLL